ncbi:MAG: hypothetical protein ABIZ80_03965 [Bryobacteraceae bacterium]
MHRSRLLLIFAALFASLPSFAQIKATAVGHEFRQDDWPSIASAPDGSMWISWLSFAGDRDDVVMRHYKDGKWGNIQWVPNTSGDSFLPQVAVDSSNRVWVVWSQMEKGNWDLYARRFDPEKQEWSTLERLTTDPLPDINPRMVSNGRGRFALVWQGFRGKNSNIFLKTFENDKWSGAVRVTRRTVNDWEPSVAFDSKGAVWIAYDSYKNGNYDVFASRVRDGKLDGPEMAIATTPRFEARATVAVDSSDRVWIAWEAGQPNWGKDQGYVIRDRAPGVPLGGIREPRILCYDGGQWREPQTALSSTFQGNTYQPHVFADGRGSVWVAAKVRTQMQPQMQAGRPRQSGYWQYELTRFTGSGWSKPVVLPTSKGRSSSRINATLSADGGLSLIWPTDNRDEGYYHRPLRQQVFAGTVPAPGAPGSPAWKSSRDEQVTVKPGAHSNEAADLRAIRAYTAPVGGKPMHIVRGDFHRHTELSWDGGGSADGSLQDFYRYMIDAASMDFGASTDHQGGAWPYWWWYTQKMTDMYHVPGGYVPIFGFERSATFPNGHRNVFYAKRSESRVVPFFLKEGTPGFGFPLGPQGDEPGVGTGDLAANDTKMLYEEIRGRNGIAISHTSATRMGTDWRDNDSKLEPVVEIFQGARTNYESLEAPLVADQGKDGPHVKQAGYQAEGMVSNAWAKGYKLGIITSSDHGSTHISFAMVYTPDPSRQGVLDAIRKRHTYGATDNIILDVRMGEHFMGDEFPLTAPQPLNIKVRGTRAVARVDIIKDNKVIYTTQPNKQDVAFQFTDKGPVAGRHFYYVRVRQDDEMIAWSSPMFINYK